MSDQNSSRSGLQTAADLARLAKAAARIIRAAIATGLKGAAVAAAKEALPFLVKFAIGILIAVLVIPLLIFASIPNIFFGFDSAQRPEITEMTVQALNIGSAYMSLDAYERTQMDAIVTSLVADYEAEGMSIDEIKTVSTLTEEDLCWLIAINSVAKEQELSLMTPADIRDLSISRITHTPSLSSLLTGDGGTITTLTVRFDALDPEEVMDKLGFDDKAKNWAGVLYKALADSDALTEYGGYFTDYSPSYGGDTGYTGAVEHGDSYDNEIDISNFIRPGIKNNHDLAAYAVMAWENNWGYVWGTYGNVLSQSLFDYKLEQYPDGVGNHKSFIEEHWLGRRTTDCIGLIKGYCWLDAETKTIGYAENGTPDYGANQMYQYVQDVGTEGVDYGSMETIPEIVGLMLWKDGHAGVYVGGGYAVEAMGTEYGVVRTKIEGRGWSGWGKLPSIEYINDEGGKLR